MATINDLFSWIYRDFRFGSSYDNVERVEDRFDHSENRRKIRIYIYTDTNKYSIVANDKSNYRMSYLGCTASSRKPRAGEDWTRGNDLADGSLSERTWHRILADIVSYELVKVHKPKNLGEKTPVTKIE